MEQSCKTKWPKNQIKKAGQLRSYSLQKFTNLKMYVHNEAGYIRTI